MAYTAKYSSDTGSGANDGSSEANAWTWAQMVAAIVALGAGGGAGLHVKHKSNGGTARTTNTDTLSVGGSSTSPLIIEGYLSTPGAAGALGDGYLGRTNNHCAGGALITTNMPSITYTTGRLNPSGTWIVFHALNYTSATNTAALPLAATSMACRCAITNNGTGASAQGTTTGSRGIWDDCDISLTGASGGVAALVMGNGGCQAIGCRIVGGPAAGVQIASSSSMIGCVVYGSALSGVLMNATSGLITLTNNTIVGNTGDGINVITGSTSLQMFRGNCITDNGGYGINGVSAANAMASHYNRFRDNTSGNYNSATDWLAFTKLLGDVTTDTGGPETDYVNAAGFDYRLINGSPAQNMFYGQAAGAYQFKGGLMLPLGFNGGRF